MSNEIPTRRVRLSEEERYPFFTISDFYDESALADDLLDIPQVAILITTLHRWGEITARFEGMQKEMKQWYAIQQVRHESRLVGKP